MTREREYLQTLVKLDPEFEYLRSKLYFHTKGYPILWLEDKNYRLHRFIMDKVYELNSSRIIDHVNQNILDARLCNLRFSSNGTNLRNRKEVNPYFCKVRQKFEATVRNNYRIKHLGRFKSRVEALEIISKYYKFLQDTEDLIVFRELREKRVTIPNNSYYYSMQSPYESFQNEI